MKANKITFENFRNLEKTEVEFSPGVNVLWGENAQGKSNILEGIYYFARGKSFRGVPDRLLVRHACDFASVTLSCRAQRDAYDTLLSAVLPRAGRKRLTRGGAPLSGPRELVGSFRAVLFCPEHLSLVGGAPSVRRSFLDIALAQLSPPYVAALSAYTKTLAERSALLRQAAEGAHVRQEQWEVYADQLAGTGAQIAAARAAYTARLAVHVERCFSDMTGGREKPSLLYTGECVPDAALPPDAPLFPGVGDPAVAALRDSLSASLRNDLAREIRAGTTLHGVHRDDVELRLNGEEARLYASQGQTRSFALAMKLAEGALARDAGGEEPVYLLDDVFSELDAGRRAYLLSALGERQVVITSCEPENGITRLPDVAMFHIENGCAQAMRAQPHI